jgi:hypothetical protein
MAVKVTWAPSVEPDILSYDLERADNLTAPVWTLLVNIPHNLLGPNYSVPDGKFFYSDAGGDTAKFYRLFAYDLALNKSQPSTPFQAATTGPAIPNTVKVDHNFGTPANLRYQTLSGAPIEGALIRVFKKADFDQGLTALALAVTETDALGNWVSPVFLTTGFTYTISFAKEGLYGPDSREILV